MHGNFVDLYGAFKLGIRNLSVLVKEKKCPTEFEKGDEACGQYVEALNNLLGSDARNYMSKKWCSQDAAEMLLPLHLAYTNEFVGGQKAAGWLDMKSWELTLVVTQQWKPSTCSFIRVPVLTSLKAKFHNFSLHHFQDS